MEFRIRINLGDVIEEGDTNYGNSFNITAPLESLAEANGFGHTSIVKPRELLTNNQIHSGELES
jgi:class 3 adenylate cyclase